MKVTNLISSSFIRDLNKLLHELTKIEYVHLLHDLQFIFIDMHILFNTLFIKFIMLFIRTKVFKFNFYIYIVTQVY